MHHARCSLFDSKLVGVVVECSDVQGSLGGQSVRLLHIDNLQRQIMISDMLSTLETN